jgi:hypothetical protein
MYRRMDRQRGLGKCTKGWTEERHRQRKLDKRKDRWTDRVNLTNVYTDGQIERN